MASEQNNLTDFIIIGGGVIGCAIARELARYTEDILVLEKEEDVASGISKANSGVLHAGFNVKPGSKKAETNVRGLRRFEQLSAELGFRMETPGKVVVAQNEAEKATLEELYEQGQKNDCPPLELIGEKKLKKLQPGVKGKYALYSPETGIIKPYKFVIALAENAHANGVQFNFETEVTTLSQCEKGFRLQTSTGASFRCRWLINAAGIQADRVSGLLGETEYQHYPCRGEYYVTDKAPEKLERLVYPVPPADGAGLGIHFTPTVEGNILLGPSARYIEEREDTASTREIMETIKGEIEHYLPPLAEVNFIRNYAGIRPKLTPPDSGETADFVIRENPQFSRFIELLGIESPGLTAAPAIAEDVAEIIGEQRSLQLREDFNPEREQPVRFAHLPPEKQVRLIEENEKHGIIDCRCEQVTRAEVIRAIENPLGVQSLDAIKRRARPTMGRCQGGFCGPRIARLLIEKYDREPAEIFKNNRESQLFRGYIKD